MTGGVWVGEFERGAELGALEWVMPSMTLQIVSLRRFALPLDRALPPNPLPYPSYPPVIPADAGTHGRGPDSDEGISLGPP